MASIAATVGARGFRRWYERQLVESFAYLATGILSVIMMAVAVEMLEFRRSAAGLLALTAVAIAGGGLCVFAWRRFHYLLSRAEYLAGRATCTRCRAYGKFAVVMAHELAESPAGCSLDVRCRKCGNEWTIG